MEIKTPAGYVPAYAIAFGVPDDTPVHVSEANPLPVMLGTGQAPARSIALAGTASTIMVAGPFRPELGRPIILTLSDGWTGSVQILRSIDEGATRVAITQADGSPKGLFRGAVNAAVAIETVAAATYYLALSPQTGSIAYRMEQ